VVANSEHLPDSPVAAGIVADLHDIGRDFVRFGSGSECSVGNIVGRILVPVPIGRRVSRLSPLFRAMRHPPKRE
jgi:hypothetical protein